MAFTAPTIAFVPTFGSCLLSAGAIGLVQLRYAPFQQTAKAWRRSRSKAMKSSKSVGDNSKNTQQIYDEVSFNSIGRRNSKQT